MIKLELEINEVNQILDALGDQPFKSVFQLVNKIQQQAATQLQEENKSATEVNSTPNIEQS
jgi:hypothetical protein